MSGLLRVDEKIQKLLFWLFYSFNFAALLILWLYAAVMSCSGGEWGITEFLINFHGGYVRRGLLGEILHYLCANTGYTPNVIIVPLCLCCFTGFVLFMCRMVKKLHFCWLVLLTNYGIFGADLIRKDYLVFLLLAAALWLYSNIEQRVLRFIAPLLAIIVMLHIHEASFFYCVPVYFLILFSDKTSGFSFVEKAGQVTLTTITMAVLCLYKGDKGVADAIVNSWQVVYSETYRQFFSCSIAAIGWDSSHAFDLHYNYNFVKGTIPYSGFILRPAALIVILFLMVRVGLRSHLGRNIPLVEKFIYISLLLFLTLMPMFTVLSCDFRRVVFYWMISSLIALYYLQNERIFLMNISVVQNGLACARRLILTPCNGKIPYILLLAFGIPYMGNPLTEYGPPALSFIMKAVERIVGVLS